MIVLYDLRADEENIRVIQEASLNTEYGLKITHGLVGSPEWWGAIDRGALLLRRFNGVVDAMTGGPMGDWPTVRIRSNEGRTKSWSLDFPVTCDLIGKAVLIEYVEQEAKKPPFPGYRNELILRFLLLDE